MKQAHYKLIEKFEAQRGTIILIQTFAYLYGKMQQIVKGNK